MLTNGYTLKLLIAKFNIRLSVEEWVGLPIATTMGNYIAPFSGGMVARATYLKQRHTLPYAQFMSILTATYCVNFWVVGLVGGLAWLGFYTLSQPSWLIGAIFIGVMLGISLLVLLPPVKIQIPGRLGRIVQTTLAGWYIIRQDKRLLFRLIGNYLLIILWLSLEFWVAYNALYQGASYQAALMISLMTMFSQVFNLTPGNFGVPEAMASMTAGLLGGNAGETLVVTLLIRATTILIAFTLGPFFTWRLSRSIAKTN
jgi:uncharacterized membrane protein YbhN (UPF0104 family)